MFTLSCCNEMPTNDMAFHSIKTEFPTEVRAILPLKITSKQSYADMVVQRQKPWNL